MITLKGNDVVSKFSMTKQKFINQWLRHFAKGVTKKQIEQYVKDQFIWHIFSYELIKPASLLDGDDARRAFDQIEKNDCICCDMFGSNGVTNKLSNRFDTAKKIDAEMLEFYVVASDYSWTYTKTHEDEFCGPYFLRNTE